MSEPPVDRIFRHRRDPMRQVDSRDAKTIKSDSAAVLSAATAMPAATIDHGDQPMTSPTSKLRARLKLCAALGAAAIMLFCASLMVEAQVVEGVQKGAREGNKAAGPVGGVLGGAIGGVVGVVTGVTGVITGKNGQPEPAAQTPNDKGKASPANDDKDKQGNAAKTAKAPAKGAKTANAATAAKPPVVLTQQSAPTLTA